jgi:hypothetical protein
MTARWTLAAFVLAGSATIALAQVATGTQQHRRGAPPTGGTASTGSAVRTQPSNNPFKSPITQPIPPATSTVNPQQNYTPPVPPSPSR